jgi:hypothetical protein
MINKEDSENHPFRADASSFCTNKSQFNLRIFKKLVKQSHRKITENNWNDRMKLLCIENDLNEWKKQTAQTDGLTKLLLETRFDLNDCLNLKAIRRKKHQKQENSESEVVMDVNRIESIFQSAKYCAMFNDVDTSSHPSHASRICEQSFTDSVHTSTFNVTATESVDALTACNKTSLPRIDSVSESSNGDIVDRAKSSAESSKYYLTQRHNILRLRKRQESSSSQASCSTKQSSEIMLINEMPHSDDFVHHDTDLSVHSLSNSSDTYKPQRLSTVEEDTVFSNDADGTRTIGEMSCPSKFKTKKSTDEKVKIYKTKPIASETYERLLMAVNKSKNGEVRECDTEIVAKVKFIF